MKKLTALLLTLLALACLSCAAAEGTAFGAATIDGLDADRVHLRAAPSTDAASLGLYFTGTRAVCLSDPAQPWVQVTIGAETGYMMSRYLSMGDVASRQPAAAVSAAAGVNLRRAPSLKAELVTTLKRGTALTVLGETADHWYYVTSGSQAGYVMAQYVTLETPDSTGSSSGPTTLTLDASDCALAYVRASNCCVYVHPTDGSSVSCAYDPSLMRLDASTARSTNILFFESVSGDPVLASASAAHVYLPRAQYESVTLDAANGRGYLCGGLDSNLVVHGSSAELDVCIASNFTGSCLVSLTDSEGTITVSEANENYTLNVTNIQGGAIDFINIPGVPAYRPGTDSYAYAAGNGAVQLTVDPLTRSTLTLSVMSARWTDQ